MNMLFRLLTELSSRKTISRLAGKFAKSGASRWLIPKFAKAYGIRLDEAEKPLHEYRTLNEFFTRRLKEGLRPVHDDPAALVSPVDARITGFGRIEAGVMMNIKGQDYTVEELLNRSPRAVNYATGYFIVLYLSPTDYHRIHAPASGVIVEKEHVPGKVYPVNDFGLTLIRRVLSRNERLITYIRTEFGEIALVKVGAMNVSGIRYVDPLSDRLTQGEELAMFEFGSTVVLLTEAGIFEPRTDLGVGERVRVGELLGMLHGK